jgi:hypothetical protein
MLTFASRIDGAHMIASSVKPLCAVWVSMSNMLKMNITRETSKSFTSHNRFGMSDPSFLCQSMSITPMLYPGERPVPSLSLYL